MLIERVETVVLLNIVFWNMWYFFLWFFDEYKVKKNSIYLKKNFVLQYTMLFKSLGSVIYFFKEINTFIQEGCVKLINVIVKTYIVRKDFYFEQMLFFWTLYSSKNQRKKYHMFQKTILSSTTVSTLIINQHIRMISEGSCDTEDWSNDAENSALITEINSILKCIKIGTQY